MEGPVATRTKLLDLAQRLTQTRGLKAFSFKDLAGGVGISTAGVHHHFATKGDRCPSTRRPEQWIDPFGSSVMAA